VYLKHPRSLNKRTIHSPRHAVVNDTHAAFNLRGLIIRKLDYQTENSIIFCQSLVITQLGKIVANLKIGANLVSSAPVVANSNLCNRGVQVIGSGFIISAEDAAALDPDGKLKEKLFIRPYLNGKDLTQQSRQVEVIDLFGLTEAEARNEAPSIYQRLLTTVKPDRDQNKRDSYRLKWWIHGEPRSELRKSLANLPRYIATVETSKHRCFTFLDHSILPDNKLINFALSDAFSLGILSSEIHVAWALNCSQF